MKKVLPLSLCLLLMTTPKPLLSEKGKVRDLFSKAYSLFSQGDLTPARDLFLRALDRGFVLDDYILYFLGAISFSRGDLKSAREYGSQLKNKYPQSVWIHDVDLQLTKIFLKEKNYGQAITRLKVLGARDMKRPILTEALYLLGQTYERQGKYNRAYSAFQRLRRKFPLSSWNDKTKTEVIRLRKIQPRLFGLKEPQAILQEFDLLLRERDFGGAERTLLKLHDLPSKPNLRFRKLRGLARVYRKTRMRQKEANVLEEILRRFPEGSSAAKALNRLAQIYWNRGEDLKALATFERLKKFYPKSPRVDFAELASARIFESLDKPDEAIRIYRNFSKKFSHSPLRHQATWRLAWRHYVQGDYHHAQVGFEKLAAGNGPKRYTIGALFWQARTAERLGNPAEAKRLYGQILKAKDANYYMGLAAKRLKRTGGAIRKNETSGEPSPTEVAPSLNPNLSFHFSRARELASLSLHRLAVAELDRIKDQTPSASPLRLTLMRTYARNRAFDRSVVLASRLNHPTRNLKRYLFPLAYWETIKESAHKRGLDPFLILALIRQESLFDPEALSPASAFGLMQLLVSTAGREARQMGLTAPAPEKLFNPELNIKLGSRHLKGLLQIYSNSLVKALAAYNAGKNAVDRWEREIPVKDEEEFVERIPYRETRNYVKLVLRNYFVYKSLYDRRP